MSVPVLQFRPRHTHVRMGSNVNTEGLLRIRLPRCVDQRRRAAKTCSLIGCPADVPRSKFRKHPCIRAYYIIRFFPASGNRSSLEIVQGILTPQFSFGTTRKGCYSWHILGYFATLGSRTVTKILFTPIFANNGVGHTRKRCSAVSGHLPKNSVHHTGCWYLAHIVMGNPTTVTPSRA